MNSFSFAAVYFLAAVASTAKAVTPPENCVAHVHDASQIRPDCPSVSVALTEDLSRIDLTYDLSSIHNLVENGPEVHNAVSLRECEAKFYLDWSAPSCTLIFETLKATVEADLDEGVELSIDQQFTSDYSWHLFTPQEKVTAKGPISDSISNSSNLGFFRNDDLHPLEGDRWAPFIVNQTDGRIMLWENCENAQYQRPNPVNTDETVIGSEFHVTAGFRLSSPSGTSGKVGNGGTFVQSFGLKWTDHCIAFANTNGR